MRHFFVLFYLENVLISHIICELFRYFFEPPPKNFRSSGDFVVFFRGKLLIFKLVVPAISRGCFRRLTAPPQIISFKRNAQLTGALNQCPERFCGSRFVFSAKMMLKITPVKQIRYFVNSYIPIPAARARFRESIWSVWRITMLCPTSAKESGRPVASFPKIRE